MKVAYQDWSRLKILQSTYLRSTGGVLIVTCISFRHDVSVNKFV